MVVVKAADAVVGMSQRYTAVSIRKLIQRKQWAFTFWSHLKIWETIFQAFLSITFRMTCLIESYLVRYEQNLLLRGSSVNLKCLNNQHNHYQSA